MVRTQLVSPATPGKYEFASVPAARTTQAPGASPWVYTNNTANFQSCCIVGGTVSNVELSRDESTFDSIQATTGAQVNLGPGDSVRITYTVAPTFSIYNH